MTPSISTDDDTIAAIATPPGSGGIAILRLSGPGSLAALGSLFSPLRKTTRNFRFLPRHMHYGQAKDRDGRPLDTVLAVYMPAPYSATGEDVGEIHCHGGAGVAAALLEAAVDAGARLAGPGEFTRRAFLRGRMDLTQAEAVAELINAPTREGVRLAAAKLDGSLARMINELRDSLEALRTRLILEMDFPEEYAELPPQEDFSRTVALGRELVCSLLETFKRARLWREGALAVLAGRVNTGKSSLLNALLGRPRAIVSDEPGTTRDYLEETVNIKGVPLRLVDTAGLRSDGGAIESEGVRRAISLTDKADMVLFVVDSRYPLRGDEYTFFLGHAQALCQKKLLLVLNKKDLLSPTPGEASKNAEELRLHLIADSPGDVTEFLRLCPCFAVSARTGEGLEQLAEGMRAALAGPGMAYGARGEAQSEGKSGADGTKASLRAFSAAGDIAPNLRQSQLLQKAEEELQALQHAVTDGYPPDVLIQHLERTTIYLDEVTGGADNDELLNRIFSSFCIGK